MALTVTSLLSLTACSESAEPPANTNDKADSFGNDVCGGCDLGSVCSTQEKTCEVVSTIDCRELAALCLSDQTCDEDTGYCRGIDIDTELAFDVQLYDLDVEFITEELRFDANLALYFAATKESTNEITLDIGKEIAGVVPYNVTAVQDTEGNALVFAEDPEAGTLRIELADTMGVNETTVVNISYAGVLNVLDTDDVETDQGMLFRDGKNEEPILQTFGWPDATRRWMPSQDHPRDIARFQSNITVDRPDFTVLSNGIPVEGPDLQFMLRQQVPVYAMHIVAGNFEHIELPASNGVPIDAYVHPNDAANAKEALKDVPLALHLMTQELGPFEFDRYAMIAVPSTFGGMEHATVISIADTKFDTPEEARNTALHELTHHWWGDNMHQREWNAFWLNESLATFWTLRLVELLDGADVYRKKLDDLNGVITRNPAFFATDPLHYDDALGAPRLSDPEHRSTFYSPYYYGPWVVHMLRQQLGDKDFFAFFKQWYMAGRFEAYNTRKLETALSRFLEEPDSVSEFFEQWVYGKGWPQLQIEFAFDESQAAIAVAVSQTQENPWAVYSFADSNTPTVTFRTADGTECAGALPVSSQQLSEQVVIPCSAAPVAIAAASPDALIQVVPLEPFAAGNLVITEIMANPGVLADSDGEWAELHHAGENIPYTIDNCQLRTESGDHPITGGILAAGNYGTIAKSSDVSFSATATSSGMTLRNDSDTFGLVCNGIVIDEVSYSDVIEAGVSLQLSPSANNAEANDDLSNWCLSTNVMQPDAEESDLGTPNAANTDCAK